MSSVLGSGEGNKAKNREGREEAHSGGNCRKNLFEMRKSRGKSAQIKKIKSRTNEEQAILLLEKRMLQQQGRRK